MQPEFSVLFLASPPINLLRTRKNQFVLLIVAQKVDKVLFLDSDAGSKLYIISGENHQLAIGQLVADRSFLWRFECKHSPLIGSKLGI